MSQSSFGGAVSAAKDREHVPDTALAPASAGMPTAPEVKAWNDALTKPHTDTVLFYTADDTPTNAITYVFHSDKDGDITLVEEPASLTADIKREVFDAVATAATTVTAVNAFPNDLEELHVYRNGVLQYQGAGNDYTVAGQVVTFADAFDNTGGQEIIQLLWVVQEGSYYRQHFDAETNGTTAITVTENLGALPANSSFVQVFRNGLIQYEGAGNDYTIAGSVITLDPAIDNTSGQEIITVTFNI